MELKEITGLFEMDSGAPSPLIIANDTGLFVTFYANDEHQEEELHQRNTVYDTGIVVIKFNFCVRHSFGAPGDETLHGHPYYKLGMQSYAFYELKGSDLIDKLKKIDSVHQYYKADSWKDYKHYILTFHDNMFECVAKEFEVHHETASVYNQAIDLIREMAARQI